MFAVFNPAASRLAVASDAGFQIFDLPPKNSQFRRVRNETSLGPITCIAIEEKSQMAVCVQGNPGTHMAQRVLVIYDMSKNETVTEMDFEAPILSVKVNNFRLAVISEKRINLFDWETLTPLPQITTMPLNKRGLGVMSKWAGMGSSCYFVWPHTEKAEGRGDIVVLEMPSSKMQMIPAHQNTVVAVEISESGHRIATCSIKGTVIRVFSNPNSQLLHTFRRGQKEAFIYALSFSGNADVLAAASTNGTLHLFQCGRDENSLVSSAEGVRSFAKTELKPNVHSIVAVSEDCTTLSLLPLVAAGEETTLEQYSILKDKVKKGNEFRIR